MYCQGKMWEGMGEGMGEGTNGQFMTQKQCPVGSVCNKTLTDFSGMFLYNTL